MASVKSPGQLTAGKKRASSDAPRPCPVALPTAAAPRTPASEPSRPQGVCPRQPHTRIAASLFGANPGFGQSSNGSSQPGERLSATETHTAGDGAANVYSMVPSDNLVRSCLARDFEKDLTSEDESASSDGVSTLCELHENLEKVNLFAQDCHLPDGTQFTVDSSCDNSPAAQLPEAHSLAIHSRVADLPANLLGETPVNCYEAQRYLGPMKRGVDDGTPSAKRSRCTPDMSVLQLSRLASPASSATYAGRAGDCLQWSGPSTYRIRCQDDLEHSVPLSLGIVGSRYEDVAEVLFRPVPSPGCSPPAVVPDWPRRRLDFCPSARLPTPLSPLASKRWPYALSSSVGMVDTHCHLDFLFRKLSFKGTFAKFRLLNQDTFPSCYEGCVAIFCNPLTFGDRTVWEDLLREDGIWAAFGCHPHMVRDYDEETDEHLIKALEHPRVVALGEIGLDYSRKNFCQREMQKSVFQRQITLALERKLPLVIHSREATQDTLNILKENIPREYPVHRHCFTGDWAEAVDWLETFPGLCLGLTPLVGFADAGPLQEVARRIPLDRLLLETDAPYFLPRAESGAMRQSHPGMAIHVALKVSSLKNISVEDVLKAVRVNTRRIYGI
ncbi:unnamed protein product [Ixodes pacificus]